MIQLQKIKKNKVKKKCIIKYILAINIHINMYVMLSYTKQCSTLPNILNRWHYTPPSPRLHATTATTPPPYHTLPIHSFHLQPQARAPPAEHTTNQNCHFPTNFYDRLLLITKLQHQELHVSDPTTTHDHVQHTTCTDTKYNAT